MTGLCQEPSREAHINAHEARPRAELKDGQYTILDLDYRPMFWDSEEEARAQVARILPHVTVAIGNDKECAVAVGEGTPDEQADRLLAAGVEIAVVKLGPEGVMAKTRTERVVSAPVPVETVNGLGAGDSFGGAFCHGLLSGWPLAQVLDYANAAGAIVASRLSCADAMPTPDEVISLLAERGRLAERSRCCCSRPGCQPTHPRRSGPVSLTPGTATLAVDDDPRRYAHLSTIRLEDPEAVARAAKARRRHPGPKSGRQNFIVAADHPARGALAVGSDPVAMADRRQLLDRLRIALANPAVDGVLASPDIMDDLLLLGALEGKLLFGSMNRGGLTGLVNEFDDRFTGHTAAALEALGADGGKMLTRICLGDPDTVSMLEATAKAIDSLAERKLIAMVEPFLSVRENGRVRNDLSTDAVIKSIAIAEGLGSTSAYTWMKLPVVAEMERVMAATTMPTVLLGGDPEGTQDEVFASWEAALALPGVQGLTVGRTLLYPQDGDVAGAVAAAASLLNHTTEASE